jgi:hypothetical protein
MVPISPHTTSVLLRFLKFGRDFAQLVEHISFIGIRKFGMLDGVTGLFEFLFDAMIQPWRIIDSVLIYSKVTGTHISTSRIFR